MNNNQFPTWTLENSVQINDGLTQTSADGAVLAFDKKYGIMFCSYMPGRQGSYGESRGKISLSYFPATQPTNIRFVDIAEDDDVYCSMCIPLGNGRVRVIYEKHSKADRDHSVCYKDFDFLSQDLSEEKEIMVKRADGTLSKLCLSEVYAYLDSKGLHNYRYCPTEQWAACAPFVHKDGKAYAAYTTVYSEPVLYRSDDNFATVEFFAAYPKAIEYEFGFRILDGKIYAIYRTENQVGSIHCTTSDDMGETWSEAIAIEDSIPCRPGIVVHKNKILISYNHYNEDTGSRPKIQQARTSIRFKYGVNDNPSNYPIVGEVYRKYGTVNTSMIDILNDVYFAFSTSEAALENHNGNPIVRGKDAIRYVKLGDVDTWK